MNFFFDTNVWKLFLGYTGKRISETRTCGKQLNKRSRMNQDLSKKEKLEQVPHWGIHQQVDQTVDAVKPPLEEKQGNTNIHLEKLTGQGLKSAGKAWKAKSSGDKKQARQCIELYSKRQIFYQSNTSFVLRVYNLHFQILVT